jgi:glycerate kinase
MPVFLQLCLFMNLVIAADKFKGSLDSFQVCDAVARGLQRAMPEVRIAKLPLSDGGDGLTNVLAHYTGAEKVFVKVSDPLFRPVQACYLLSAEKQTAVIEMAQASGLMLLKPGEYNPMQTTTYGTGELIKHALRQGVSKLIVGIGGSATNDCGIGMAAALGCRFLDAQGAELKPVGESLAQVQTIDVSRNLLPKGVRVEVVSDVSNFLTGAGGAARLYAPQKGATPVMVEALENGMLRFADVVKQQFGIDLNIIQGGGAAGGMGAGCVLFLGAALSSGVELLLTYSNAEHHIQAADLVITGEGKLDAQSLQGKVVHGVTELCKTYGKPVVALCGTVDMDISLLQVAGLTAAFSIITKPMSLDEAQAGAALLLEQAACNLGNFFKTSYSS